MCVVLAYIKPGTRRITNHCPAFRDSHNRITLGERIRTHAQHTTHNTHHITHTPLPHTATHVCKKKHKNHAPN